MSFPSIKEQDRPKYFFGDENKRRIFRLPRIDDVDSDDIVFTVKITIGRNANGKVTKTGAFEDINLFTVRIPGIRLLEKYANDGGANDLLEKIAQRGG